MQQAPKRSLAGRLTMMLGVVVPLAAAGFMAGPAHAAVTRVTIRRTRPGWASKSKATGHATGILAVKVYVTPRGGEAALKAAVAAVSTPGSPSYRHFITPAQYRATFGPDASAVSRVSAWLSGAGMTVHGLDAGHRFVSATGSVASAEQAFGATLSLYRNGTRIMRAPTSDLSVPSTVASDVLGVVGLESPSVMKTAAQYPSGFRNARPCSLWYGQLVAKYQADHQTPLPQFKNRYRKYAVCGYTPSQFRSAYGVDNTDLTGAGVTVAITDAYGAPTIRSDANTYATLHGDAAFGPGQFTQSRPDRPFTQQDECGSVGWYGEETLDVEAVHGMAPDANIIYYASRSCFDVDFLEDLNRVVDDNTASIVTNSWGEPSEFETEGVINAYEQVFLQGAMQGIGFMFSSGDSGDDLLSTGLVQTDYPTSDPYVTSVGGTTTAIGIDGTLVNQTGWGVWKYSLSEDQQSWEPIATPPFLYGAGGGFSSLFNRPDYQNGVIPPGSPAGRAVPDIALDADPTTGMLVGETQEFPDGIYFDQFRIGGTSLASPLMAGMQALAEQNAGIRLGFANPAIYALQLSDPGVYNDVLPLADANVRPDYVNGVDPTDGIVYSVRTDNQDSSLTTVIGWDDVTGVGQPNDGYLTAFGS